MTETWQGAKTSKYADIMHLTHPVSANHPQMSRYDRAAQFSPFAALTGYEEAILEAQRMTEQKAELSENRMEELEQKLQLLRETAGMQPKICVTYFRKDAKKEGGRYLTAEGRLGKIHADTKELELTSGLHIPMMDISEIKGELFWDF